MDHCLISNLIPDDDNPRICVRLSRLWEFFDTRDESVLLHVGLVLIDETGDSIAAQIYPPNDVAFRNILAEGKAYYFTYYKVKPAPRTYKPVANSLGISFTKWTAVDEYIELPEKFPRYTFAPKRFDEFPPLVDRKDSFIDTIGIVTGVSTLTSVHSRTRNGTSSKRNVFLRDANNNTTHISLWGEHAIEFPADDVHRKGQKEPVIIIFVGTLVKSFKGDVYLSGNNACKWYINFECPEIDMLRSSIKDSYGGITWIELSTSNTVRPLAEERTVLEIKDLHPFIHKKSEFIVTVTIRKIDGNWWYVSCDRCKKTAKRYGRGYRCGDKDCPPVVSASPRLKLAVIAGDETADTNFVLFGRVAQRLIGRSIDLLLDQNPCDIDFIPKEITDLLEKEFKFNVSFTDTTLSSGIVSFQVNYIVTGDTTDTPLLLSPSAS